MILRETHSFILPCIISIFHSLSRCDHWCHHGQGMQSRPQKWISWLSNLHLCSLWIWRHLRINHSNLLDRSFKTLHNVLLLLLPEPFLDCVCMLLEWRLHREDKCERQSLKNSSSFQTTCGLSNSNFPLYRKSSCPIIWRYFVLLYHQWNWVHKIFHRSTHFSCLLRTFLRLKFLQQIFQTNRLSKNDVLWPNFDAIYNRVKLTFCYENHERIFSYQRPCVLSLHRRWSWNSLSSSFDHANTCDASMNHSKECWRNHLCIVHEFE